MAPWARKVEKRGYTGRAYFIIWLDIQLNFFAC
jgi:hypothetical protein